jgi:hypothetical protein
VWNMGTGVLVTVARTGARHMQEGEVRSAERSPRR